MKRPRGSGRILVLLLVGAVAAGVLLRERTNRSGRFLEIEVATSGGSSAQVYWDVGEGFTETRSVTAPLEPTRTFQTIRFPLPGERIDRLRLDPMDSAGTVLVRRMRVLSSSGAVISEPNPQSLFPVHHIAAILRGDGVTRVVTEPTGSDPALRLNGSSLEVAAPWYALTAVTPLSVSLASAAMLGLIGLAVWHVVREVLDRSPADAAGHPVRVGRVMFWLVALFVLTVSAKLYTLHRLPLPVPTSDQWAAEPDLYIAFSEGSLPWHAMFALHNEHRIFFTRLWDLLLLVVNPQWDTQLQAVTNAMFHALTAALLAATLWLACKRRWLDLIVLGCALTFVTPFAWENTALGFQSAFYFLLLFSALAIWLTSRHPLATRGWALGWTCALCSLFTSAGGLITVGVTATMALWRGFHDRDSWRRMILNLAVSGTALAIGVISMSDPLPGHTNLGAATLSDFASALTRNLAWPWIDDPRFVWLVWLPVLLALTLAAIRRPSVREANPWLSGLALWVVLQAAALAFARGARTQPLAARYMDFLSVGLLVNVGALTSLLRSAPGSPIVRGVLAGGVAAWLAFCAAGLDRVTQDALLNAAGVARWEASWADNLRRFVATDDLVSLAARTFPHEIPYPSASALANGWLRHPYIRKILPSTLREPLPLQVALLTNGGFVQNGVYPTVPADPVRLPWGSFTSRHNQAQGRFESTAVPECSGRLQFEVAGYLGERGLSLAVRSMESGRETPVEVPDLAGERWMQAYVRCPDGPFQIVAVDASARYWFAFRSPVNVPLGSMLAQQLIAASRTLLIVAIALAVIAVRLPP